MIYKSTLCRLNNCNDTFCAYSHGDRDNRDSSLYLQSTLNLLSTPIPDRAHKIS